MRTTSGSCKQGIMISWLSSSSPRAWPPYLRAINEHIGKDQREALRAVLLKVVDDFPLEHMSDFIYLCSKQRVIATPEVVACVRRLLQRVGVERPARLDQYIWEAMSVGTPVMVQEAKALTKVLLAENLPLDSMLSLLGVVAAMRASGETSSTWPIPKLPTADAVSGWGLTWFQNVGIWRAYRVVAGMADAGRAHELPSELLEQVKIQLRRVPGAGVEESPVAAALLDIVEKAVE